MYKLLAKRVEGREYLITDFLATQLSKKKFLELQKINDCLKGFVFLDPRDIDCFWWSRCTKYLTGHKLIDGAAFDCDYYGNVSRLW